MLSDLSDNVVKFGVLCLISRRERTGKKNYHHDTHKKKFITRDVNENEHLTKNEKENLLQILQ